MTSEMKGELTTWIQYFAIALAAEIGTFFVLMFRSCDGCQYSLETAWRTIERPRLVPWFVIFALLGAGRFLVSYAVHHYRQNDLK
jgi:hypothetical protein